MLVLEIGNQVKQTHIFAKEEIQAENVPQWGMEFFKSFEADMLQEETPFPCVFGVEGFKQGNLRFFFAEDPYNPADLMKVRNALIEYTQMFRTLGRMTSFVAFFKPTEQIESLESYQELFWSVLKFLHENDPQEWPGQIPQSTEDPLWEFCFNAEPIFVVCNTPAHNLRRSRSAKGFMITFQPRWVFEELTGEKGEKGKALVRKRLEKYDQVSLHPAMGSYGDPDNLEWKQYYITDSNDDTPAKCPFHAMMKGESKMETTMWDRVRMIEGEPMTLEQSIFDLLPADHFVAVQNDMANTVHAFHKHANNETLLIVKGQLTLATEDQEFVCHPGDRILLPRNTVHESRAGSDGCLYIILKHED